MRRKVRLDPDAHRDLEEIFGWIADRAGVPRAEAYTARLRAYCESFTIFPHRGVARIAFRPELRLIGFERRVTIAFMVTDHEVLILRLFYGGRDVETILTVDD